MKLVLFSKILTVLFTIMNTVPNIAGIILFKRSSPNFASNVNIKRICQLLFPLKSTKNRRFSDDFRGNGSQLIYFNWFNIRIDIWRRSLRYFRKLRRKSFSWFALTNSRQISPLYPLRTENQRLYKGIGGEHWSEIY